MMMITKDNSFRNRDKKSPSSRRSPIAKLLLSIFLSLFLVHFSIALAQDTRTLRLNIAFLDEPPYEWHWWPWSDTYFRLEVSICNLGDSILAIPHFTPCYDCEPKNFLEAVETGQEPERTMELDVLYMLDDRLFYDLNEGNCHVDTIDFARYIEWDLSDRSTYRLWLVFNGEPNYEFADSTRTTEVWRRKLISDTLEFKFY